MVVSQQIPNIHVIGIYHSKTKATILQLIYALTHLHNSALMEPTVPTVLLGNFNIDLIQGNSEKKAHKKCLIADKGYTQLINQFTTDYRTQIDHVYRNVPQCVQSAGTRESYYNDHKPIYIAMKATI